MLELTLILKGVILGIAAAAPTGPVNLLCIKRTITQGRLAGISSGLGAAFADTMLGFIAAFGLTFASEILMKNQFTMKILGGLLLIGFGLKTYFSKPERIKVKPSHQVFFDRMYGLAGDFASTVFLTLTNPLTLIYFTTVFTGLGIIDAGGSHIKALMLLAGILTGSIMWWIVLVEGVTLIRSSFSIRILFYANRVTGILILVFGIGLLISMFFHF